MLNEEGGSTFIYRSTVSNNSAHQGGGLLDDGNTPQVGSVVVEDSVFENNVAHGAEGGGARFFGRPTRVTRVVFSNNTAAFGGGGGAVVGSGTPASFHDCTFVGNVALKGGALSGNGEGAVVQVVSTTFRRNIAFLEGGGEHSRIQPHSSRTRADAYTPAREVFLWSDTPCVCVRARAVRVHALSAFAPSRSRLSLEHTHECVFLQQAFL